MTCYEAGPGPWGCKKEPSPHFPGIPGGPGTFRSRLSPERRGLTQRPKSRPGRLRRSMRSGKPPRSGWAGIRAFPPHAPVRHARPRFAWQKGLRPKRGRLPKPIPNHAAPRRARSGLSHEQEQTQAEGLVRQGPGHPGTAARRFPLQSDRAEEFHPPRFSLSRGTCPGAPREGSGPLEQGQAGERLMFLELLSRSNASALPYWG